MVDIQRLFDEKAEILCKNILKYPFKYAIII